MNTLVRNLNEINMKCSCGHYYKAVLVNVTDFCRMDVIECPKCKEQILIFLSSSGMKLLCLHNNENENVKNSILEYNKNLQKTRLQQKEIDVQEFNKRRPARVRNRVRIQI